MPLTAKGAWRSTELDVLRTLRKLRFASARDIGAALSLTHKWVAVKLRILKSADRIYVADWKRYSVQGDWRQIYGIKETGEEEDAKKPEPLGNARNKNYQRRKRLMTLLSNINSNQEGHGNEYNGTSNFHIQEPQG